MKGDFHARFCERRRVRFPPPTHLIGVSDAADRRRGAGFDETFSVAY